MVRHTNQTILIQPFLLSRYANHPKIQCPEMPSIYLAHKFVGLQSDVPGLGWAGLNWADLGWAGSCISSQQASGWESAGLGWYDLKWFTSTSHDFSFNALLWFCSRGDDGVLRQQMEACQTASTLSWNGKLAHNHFHPFHRPKQVIKPAKVQGQGWEGCWIKSHCKGQGYRKVWRIKVVFIISLSHSLEGSKSSF